MKKNTFTKIFDNNSLLKIISVFVAIIIWFIISTIIIPDTTRSIAGVTLDIDAIETSLAESGLKIIDADDITTSVFVQGGSYTVGLLEPEDFLLTVDLTDVTKPGEYELNLKAEPANALQNDFSILYSRPNTVTLVFDRYVDKQFALDASAPNLVIQDGYIQEKLIPTTENIILTGPESEISQITKCVIENDESMSITSSTQISGEIVFYGSNNNILELENVSYDMQNFNIYVPIYLKQTVPLTFDYVNVPQGFDVETMKYEMLVEEITVGLPTDTVANIEEISLGTIDFREIGIGSVFTFDIELLTGYINIDNISHVSVEFESFGMSETTLTVDNIILNNVPSNFDVTLISEVVADVKIVGDMQTIANLTPSDVRAIVNFSNANLSEGEQTATANISMVSNKNAWATGEYTVLVRVQSKTESKTED